MLATPPKVRDYTSGDFGDQTISSLEVIIDNPISMLGQSRVDTGNVSHSHLDILSASRYPQALMPGYESGHTSNKRKQPHDPVSHHLYGGIFSQSQPLEPSNASSSVDQEEQEPEPARPKKRARKSKKDDEDANDESKRQRGRPRLDTQDETAADRRRTQIRLAQRAYRNRKETTISGLKQQVAALQGTIGQMNKSFLDLHDDLIDAGITTSHVKVARKLKQTTKEFVALAKITEDENDDEEATKISELTNSGNGSHANQFKSESQPVNDIQQSPSHGSPSDDAEIVDLPPGRDAYPYMENSWAMGNDIMSFRAEVPQSQAAMEEILGEKARQAAVRSFPNSTLEYSLSLPPGKHGTYTYSFQETNFARRLHRRTLENGWRSLTNASTNPVRLNRVFRFTFCFSNRKRIVSRFKHILQRKAGEALENWNVPFFNIGGAGTHFPRRDFEGKPIYPPNILSPEKALVSQNMGPYYRGIGAGAETPRADMNNLKVMLEAIGYGGEWFDSHDVEGYLKTKGIHLDGHSSFVEVDPRVIFARQPSQAHSQSSMASNSTTPSENTLRTPSPTMPGYHNVMPAETTDPFSQQKMNEMYPSSFITNAAPNFNFTEEDISNFPPRQQEQLSVDEVYSQQIWPWGNYGSLSANNAWNNLFPQLASSAGQSPVYTKPLLLDVERFVENLSEGSACLGRAPGFRKDLVENALALSVAEGY